jgi:hypothetical protein
MDALLFFGELSLIVLCGYYADEIAQRLWRPRTCVPCQEWREMVEPIVKKCRLAETLEMNTTFNPDGSKALAALLERMAAELDRRC